MTNVASACGYTRSNYDELNKLHEKYNKQGLEIVAFPCNQVRCASLLSSSWRADCPAPLAPQFGRQENGSPAEICKFTTDKGVQFTVTEKIDVNGPNTHPVWKHLKAAKSGDVGWNFGKRAAVGCTAACSR